MNATSINTVSGWVGVTDGKSTILLDTRLTPELINEGIARDVIRNIQKMRKKLQLEINNKISINFVTESNKLLVAIKTFSDYILSEVLGIKLTFVQNFVSDTTVDVEISNDLLTIMLSKVVE